MSTWDVLGISHSCHRYPRQSPSATAFGILKDTPHGVYPHRLQRSPPLAQPRITTRPLYVFLTAGQSSFLTRLTSISDMSQPSSSISFKGLFDAALLEYENKTNIKLADDPLAKKLEACNSVDSITAILQQQAQVFGGFKDDGKIMKSLRSSVDVLYTLSNSSIIGQVVGLIVHTKLLILVLGS